MSEYKMLINGQMVVSEDKMSVINPSTGETIVECPRGTKQHINDAVAAAKAAYPAWAARPQSERAALLNKLADKIEARTDEIARVLTSEQGKPLAEAQGEVAFTAAFIRYFSSLDLPMKVLEDSDKRHVEMYRMPLGVVAAITPWNFPLLIVAFKLPPALLVGNTMVLKPAPTTPLTSLILGEICNEVFPAGVVNVVTDKNDLGDVLTNHPDVAKVSFTGSTATGKKVMASAAGTIKRITLELGGNDAGIVLDDAKPAEVAPGIFAGAMWNSGQVCIALKRLYVHESIYDEMCSELAKLADAAIVDDGFAQGVQFGPLQNAMQFEKVKGFLDDAKANGNVIAGGEVMDRPGYFIRPTIVRDVTDGAKIVDEEQFGPILPVIKYKNVDDVIARANASPYGLGGSVWSSDADKAAKLALKLEAGTVWVNKHIDLDPTLPFAGAKQSGLGIEFAEEGLAEFTQVRVINRTPLNA